MSENKIVLPDDMKEKGWAKSVLAEDGSVDISKVFNKIDGQESLLGKKHLPGKDASDDEWRDFAGKMTKDYQDADYDSVLDGLETKADMVAALKEQGLTPKQAAKVAELYKKERDTTIAKQFSEEDFKSEIRKELSEEEYNRAVNVLKKASRWDKVSKSMNQSAIDTIVSVAKVAIDYDIDDLPGKDGGDSSTTQGNGRGYCDDYVKRCYELVEKGMSKDAAVKQAKAEYSVI